MNLRRRTLLVIGSTYLVSILILLVVTRLVILKSFRTLEYRAVATNVHRALNGLDDDLAALKLTCRDWAAWDELHSFIAGDAPQFMENNLNDNYIENLNLDVFIVFNLKGNIVDMVGCDRANSRAADVPTSIFDWITESPEAVFSNRVGIARSGLVALPEGLLLFAAWPVAGANFKKDVNGTVLYGRFLTELDVATLEKKTRLRITINDVSSWEKRSDPVQDVMIRVVDEETIEGSSPLIDFQGGTVALLTVSMDREIYHHGIRATLLFLAMFFVASLVVLCMYLLAIRRAVLEPIARLTRFVEELGAGDDFSPRFQADRNDEIGILGATFNSLASKLQATLREMDAAHRKMLDVARVAGMVEVTGSFIHNIGNVLNSLNVDIICLEESIGRIGLTRCRALIAELKSRTHDGPNDEKDTIGNNEQFETLLRMAEMLLLTGEQAEEAIQSMKRYMEHIVNIIHMQQDFSRTSEIVDMHRLDHLVEQAVEICCTANPKVAPVRILRDFGSVPEIPIDRHKFLQILVNLLGNAIWAVQESGGQGSVTVRTDTNETGHVCVEVLDDGIGIPSENIPRIFSQGFTTRCDGHGYGLHSAANMAWEMGGKLQAFSDGPGKGARFLLELPIRQ